MSAHFRDTSCGRETLAARGHVARHRHRQAYAAVILAGGYEEAGDAGRWRVSPGDVVVHDCFEAHQDHVGVRGCTLINLDLPPGVHVAGAFRIADPDMVGRLAERDPEDAVACLLAQERRPVPPIDDWPDRLARDLGGEDIESLGGWAEAMGLAAESVSRGFRRAYGVAPSRFRLELRTRRAVALIRAGKESLAAIAQECGFADQPHLTRSLSALTGRTPGQWREARVNWVQ
jgi:AraC-like DNA-binding protein